MKNHWFRLGLGLLIAGVVLFGLFFLLKGSSLFAVKKVQIIGLTGERAQRVRNASLGQSTIDFDEEAVRSAATGKQPIRSLKWASWKLMAIRPPCGTAWSTANVSKDGKSCYG